jgi:site-specific recombinase XerD
MQSRTEWVVITPELKGADEEARPGVPVLYVDDCPEPIVCLWMVALTRRYSPDTVKTYANGIEAWWRYLLSRDLRWWEVSVMDFQDWIDKRRADGLSDSSVNTMGSAVCSFYKWAHTGGYLDHLPFRMTDGRRNLAVQSRRRDKGSAGVPVAYAPKVPRRKPRIDTTEQFDKILAHMPHTDPGLLRRDELMAECSRWMGLRRKEVVGLRVSQLRHLAEVRLNPEDPVPFFALELDPSSTKGKKGGVVLLIPALAKKLRDYIKPGGYRDQIVKRAQQRAKKAGKPYVEPDALFLTDRGTPIRRETLSTYWRRAALAAGINSRFHKNRHAAATTIASVTFEHGSQSYLIVKELLRHVDVKTSQIYVDQATLRSEIYQKALSINDLYLQEQPTGG